MVPEIRYGGLIFVINFYPRWAPFILQKTYTLHLRNQSITDQLLAWELIQQAGQGLLHWHDGLDIPRNFESSPEYAELQWYAGLFLLVGKDLESSKRCFWRIMDVDIFNHLYMGKTRNLFGLALIHEAEARKHIADPYGNLIVRDEFTNALNLAKAALESIDSTYQIDLLTDILMLLGRASEELGKTKEACRYYNQAAERYCSIHGYHKKSYEIQAKIDGIRKPKKSHTRSREITD